MPGGEGPAPSPTPAPAPPREGVARSAGIVASATMGSRVLGLARESVFAALFATSGIADAFVMAFRIPNLLRDFFAEGALASAFVPQFTEVGAKEGPERAILLARRTLGTLAAITGLIAVLGIVFAPFVVSLVAWDVKPGEEPLVIHLTRVMFPFLPLVAVAAVLMGVLNARSRYFMPALAPMLFNVVAVVGGLVVLALGLPAETAITVWAVLVVLGGLAQVVIQLPVVRAVGWRGGPLLDLRFRDPALRTIAKRMGPVVLSLAATNVMILITTGLASGEQSWVSSLNYAFRLVHLPIGIVGVALGTIVLSAGARARATQSDAALDDLGRRALRLNAFLSVPAAVGLLVLAEPLVRLLYERGAFTAESTAQTAKALRAYALGILGYAGVKAAAPLFLARGDTKTPVRCSVLGIAVNVGLAFALVGPLGHVGLALAVAAGATVNFAALRWVAWRQHGPTSFPGLAFLLRIAIAAGLMGGLGVLARLAWPGGDLGAGSRTLDAALTLGVVAVLGLAYFGLAAALGVSEGRELVQRLRRRAPR